MESIGLVPLPSLLAYCSCQYSCTGKRWHFPRHSTATIEGGVIDIDDETGQPTEFFGSATEILVPFIKKVIPVCARPHLREARRMPAFGLTAVHTSDEDDAAAIYRDLGVDSQPSSLPHNSTGRDLDSNSTTCLNHKQLSTATA